MGLRLGRRGLVSRRASTGGGPSRGTPGVVAEEAPRRAHPQDRISGGKRPVTHFCQTLQLSSTPVGVFLDGAGTRPRVENFDCHWHQYCSMFGGVYCGLEPSPP
ncbi:hypothetical protein NDU88_001034 [Pleurodeles waltl]|uniref:Uncharacterized protein n=1 Tax=Pleurodeles waltl TaxID=8319 RepID=A0AAV7NEJ8_PLEWA|nr:hypothetical protein NDU88_001034 [Pleurodeles waltl]